MLFSVSFYLRNTLPEKHWILPILEHEPLQSNLTKEAFSVALNDKDYIIKPLYDYEITGLVVSYKLHNDETGMHKRIGDSLNVADLCVVWGSNALQLDLAQFDFWNLEYTCYVQSQTMEVWQQFDMQGLSNNHVIVADPFIRKQIAKVNIGDQIRIKGYLAENMELIRERFVSVV